jgi:hypothetical protein
MELELTQTLTETSTSVFSGGKGGRGIGLRVSLITLQPSLASIVKKLRESQPLGAFSEMLLMKL